LDPPKQRAICQ
jgi:hypothetical protein